MSRSRSAAEGRVAVRKTGRVVGNQTRLRHRPNDRRQARYFRLDQPANDNRPSAGRRVKSWLAWLLTATTVTAVLLWSFWQ